jgi:hypothetical protein
MAHLGWTGRVRQPRQPSGYGIEATLRAQLKVDEDDLSDAGDARITMGLTLAPRRGPLRFVTARVRVNRDSKPTLDERHCRLGSGEPIAAIARWPSGTPTPGAEADLLAAVRLDGDDAQPQPGRSRRPS